MDAPEFLWTAALSAPPSLSYPKWWESTALRIIDAGKRFSQDLRKQEKRPALAEPVLRVEDRSKRSDWAPGRPRMPRSAGGPIPLLGPIFVREWLTVPRSTQHYLTRVGYF